MLPPPARVAVARIPAVAAVPVTVLAVQPLVQLRMSAYYTQFARVPPCVAPRIALVVPIGGPVGDTCALPVVAPELPVPSPAVRLIPAVLVRSVVPRRARRAPDPVADLRLDRRRRAHHDNQSHHLRTHATLLGLMLHPHEKHGPFRRVRAHKSLKNQCVGGVVVGLGVVEWGRTGVLYSGRRRAPAGTRGWFIL